MSKRLAITRDFVSRYLRYDPDNGVLYWRDDRPQDGMSDSAIMGWRTKFSGKAVNLGGPENRAALKINGKSFHARRVAAAFIFGECPPEAEVESIDGDLSNIKLENIRLSYENQAMILGTGFGENDVLYGDVVSKYFFYDRETGNLIWRHDRPADGMGRRVLQGWINRHAGEIAGTVLKTKYKHLQYIGVFVNRRPYKAHRLVAAMIYGEIHEDEEVDHINGIGTDNRPENIRIVTPSVNSRNRRLPAHNTSGVVGVYFAKNRWRAMDSQWRTIGIFRTKEEAAKFRAYWQENQGNFTDRHGGKHESG